MGYYSNILYNEQMLEKEKSEQLEETILDNTLRPHSLKDYVGQEQIKENLNIFLSAAQQRQESLEHVLLYGPAGLGKTTLAYIIAKELGNTIRTTSGPAIERVGELA